MKRLLGLLLLPALAPFVSVANIPMPYETTGFWSTTNGAVTIGLLAGGAIVALVTLVTQFVSRVSEETDSEDF